MSSTSATTSELIFTDESRVKAKRAALVAGGLGNLQVIADFDRTLTMARVASGERGDSCHGVMESLSVLSDEYKAATTALLDHYYPIEICSERTKEQKLPLMQEWYGQAHALLLKEGVRPEQLADAVRGSNVTLRGGVEEMFELLQRGEVPLLVFSAGIANVIAEVFKQKLRFPLVDSTHIISNWMIFDASQTHVGFSQPLIHMFNKDETQTKGTQFERAVAERKNVLLLGDGLGDVTMAEGIPHDNVLKVAFLNEKVEELLPKYRAAYDVIITHDGDMAHVVELLKEIAAQGE